MDVFFNIVEATLKAWKIQIAHDNRTVRILLDELLTMTNKRSSKSSKNYNSKEMEEKVWPSDPADHLRHAIALAYHLTGLTLTECSLVRSDSKRR